MFYGLYETLSPMTDVILGEQMLKICSSNFLLTEIHAKFSVGLYLHIQHKPGKPQIFLKN